MRRIAKYISVYKLEDLSVGQGGAAPVPEFKGNVSYNPDNVDLLDKHGLERNDHILLYDLGQKNLDADVKTYF